MKYVPLASTGIKVSQLGLGTMTFGGDAAEEDAKDIFFACHNAGINFIDTASTYNQGAAEIILGRLIKSCRDQFIIASKMYFPTSSNINDIGLSRRHIMKTVHQSLQRLGTDYIDIYYLHIFDPATHLEESLSAFNDLISQGKIHYIGASNFSAWQVMKGLHLADQYKLKKFTCIQPMYNLIKRQAESELLPMAHSENIAVFPYNPLAAGLLTGKYHHDTKNMAPGRLHTDLRYKQRYGSEIAQKIAQSFVKFCHAEKYDPTLLALAWVMHHPAITAPLLGARNKFQIDACLKAIDFEMTADLYNTITNLSIAPSSATDR